jgi:murein DD-endopeptidase MepM/ murein hydrolase activator NlpD
MNSWVWIVGGALLLLAAGAAMPWPVVGPIKSGFRTPDRPTHNGVDIAAPVGTPVRASDGGIVASTYYHEAGGNSMLLDYDNGFRAGFAHLSAYNAAEGQRVERGQVVAYTGNTGAHTTGPHLHYTLRDREGEYVNPELHHA